MPEISNAPEGQKEAVDAERRICARHKLRLAPDGLCAICRREANPPERSTGSQFVTLLFGFLMLLAVGAAAYWAIHPDEMPGERPPPTTQGPPLEDQIAVVDEQLRGLLQARAAGELGPGGMQRLSQLEVKRKLLQAALDASRD